MAFGDYFNKTHQQRTSRGFDVVDLEPAVVKSLEHYDEFIKLRETRQSLYKEHHYSGKTLPELRDLAEAFEEKDSRPLDVLGARLLPHLQTALKILFDGFKVLVMHSQNTKIGRVGLAGRQGRATFSVKFVRSLKGLLFPHLTWDIVEETAHLSKVFQADLTIVTRAMEAVNNLPNEINEHEEDEWFEAAIFPATESRKRLLQ